MAENDGRYYRFDQPRSFETVAAWIVTFVAIIGAVFLGIVAWNAWSVEKESRRVFGLLESSVQSCQARPDSGVPVRYEIASWKTSFDLPAGYLAVERKVMGDGDVEATVARRPEAESAASSNALYDASVRVRVGKDTGFSRYYAKPFTEYGGYRRFTAVGRSAIGYTDPAGAAESVQVILIDDSRNGREVVVTYTATVEGAEALAFGIIDTMRLAPMERQEVVVKPGWKVFSQQPLRFQYPEDYRVTTPFPGRVTVLGKGGRIEMASAYDLDETGRRGGASLPNGDGGAPDEFFLLRYGVDLRVAFYYAAEATAYDRSILKEIGTTVGLDE